MVTSQRPISKGSGATLFQITSQQYHLLALWLWGRSFSSLCLHFLIFKVGLIIVATPQSCYDSKWVNKCEAFGREPGTYLHAVNVLNTHAYFIYFRQVIQYLKFFNHLLCIISLISQQRNWGSKKLNKIHDFFIPFTSSPNIKKKKKVRSLQGKLKEKKHLSYPGNRKHLQIIRGVIVRIRK